MASKSVLFAVHDDPEVLRTAERDLRRKYARNRDGGGLHILRADSATTAMDPLVKLKLRGGRVALFLIDQRMPRTTGVEFLEEAGELYPEAKKVSLTAYTDTDAAIKATNDIGLGYHLQMPRDPLWRTSTLYPTTSSATGASPTSQSSSVPGGRQSPVAALPRGEGFLAQNRRPCQRASGRRSSRAGYP